MVLYMDNSGPVESGKSEETVTDNEKGDSKDKSKDSEK